MTRFRNTVVGSYPRPSKVEDTLKKPTLTQAEVDELIRWAAKDQADLGLDVITDGEGYRENMYYFYQKRLDGVSLENMPKQNLWRRGLRHRMRRGSSAKSRTRASISRITGRSPAPPRRRTCASNKPSPARTC